ncbi:hypothetical protein SRDD_32740 [Serratia sp. DD3]|nr:hypothetical protein SRDD_32740 [Serratia sp. DD3]
MMVVELNACHDNSLYIKPANAGLLIKLNYLCYHMQLFFVNLCLSYCKLFGC